MISNMIYYFIILALIGIDQISKYFVKTGMDYNQSIPLIDGIFHLTYIRNFGAAFSILQGKQIFLIVITFVTLAVILIFMIQRRKKNHWMLSLALSFIEGGGFGNLIDRIRLGYVVDLISSISCFQCGGHLHAAAAGCSFIISFVSPRLRRRGTRRMMRIAFKIEEQDGRKNGHRVVRLLEDTSNCVQTH